MNLEITEKKAAGQKPLHYQEPLREHIQDQLPQAVTRKLLRRKMSKDETLQKLREDISIGKCRPALHSYQQIFEELTEVDGLMVRGEQVLIPQALQEEVIPLAHEGHQGQDKTL